MPKLPLDLEHKTSFHELNEFMNEYFGPEPGHLEHLPQKGKRPPDQKPLGHMQIKVDLTGTETFERILNVLHFAFKRADLETQRQIYHKLKREIGKTHDLRLFER